MSVCKNLRHLGKCLFTVRFKFHRKHAHANAIILILYMHDFILYPKIVCNNWLKRVVQQFKDKTTETYVLNKNTILLFSCWINGSNWIYRGPVLAILLVFIYFNYFNYLFFSKRMTIRLTCFRNSPELTRCNSALTLLLSTLENPLN